MSEQERSTQSRRDFLSKGLTAFAYVAPVVAVLAADEARAATPAAQPKMGEGKMGGGKMGGGKMGHGKMGHGKKG